MYFCDGWGTEYLGDRGPHRFVFPVGSGVHTVVLEIDDGSSALGVSTSGKEHGVVASAGPVGHPSAVRWEELDLLCRATAVTDPDFRHPGPMLALLGPFLLLGNHDDLTVVQAALRAALDTVGPLDAAGDWAHAWRCFRSADHRYGGVVWRSDAEGNRWPCQPIERTTTRYQGPFHTMRDRADDGTDLHGFPWGQWRALLAEAEQTLATAVDPRWLDATVAKLLDWIVADADLSAVPDLADALDAAGCQHPTILRALSDPVDLIETFWVLELLTTAPRGLLVARWLDRSTPPIDPALWPAR